MKLEITRDRISVVPETAQDEVYIELVLGLVADGDSIPLVRVDVHADDHHLLRLETRR